MGHKGGPSRYEIGTSEPFTSYVARLKGQARLSNFVADVKRSDEACGKVMKHDFIDTAVMGDQDLVRGLADSEIKLEVLYYSVVGGRAKDTIKV